MIHSYLLDDALCAPYVEMVLVLNNTYDIARVPLSSRKLNRLRYEQVLVHLARTPFTLLSHIEKCMYRLLKIDEKLRKKHYLRKTNLYYFLLNVHTLEEKENGRLHIRDMLRTNAIN